MEANVCVCVCGLKNSATQWRCKFSKGRRRESGCEVNESGNYRVERMSAHTHRASIEVEFNSVIHFQVQVTSSTATITV